MVKNIRWKIFVGKFLMGKIRLTGRGSVDWRDELAEGTLTKADRVSYGCIYGGKIKMDVGQAYICNLLMLHSLFEQLSTLVTLV